MAHDGERLAVLQAACLLAGSESLHGAAANHRGGEKSPQPPYESPSNLESKRNPLGYDFRKSR